MEGEGGQGELVTQQQKFNDYIHSLISINSFLLALLSVFLCIV